MTWVKYGEEKPDWAKEDDQVLYVLIVGDLVGLLDDKRGEGTWDGLAEEQKRALVNIATKYIEGFMSGGGYGWPEAIRDAIADYEAEAGKLGGLGAAEGGNLPESIGDQGDIAVYLPQPLTHLTGAP